MRNTELVRSLKRAVNENGLREVMDVLADIVEEAENKGENVPYTEDLECEDLDMVVANLRDDLW